MSMKPQPLVSGMQAHVFWTASLQLHNSFELLLEPMVNQVYT
jgi:hypothetical protein